MPNNKALLKVDFRNAVSSIRCDKMLEAVKAYIPELLPFVHSAYSAPSILLWNEVLIPSSEGIQQGDPLGPLLFSLTIRELKSSLVSEFKVYFLDDGTMGGDLDDVTADLKRINEEGQALSLIFNVSKSELISHDQSKLGTMFSTFHDLVFVDPKDATLLGSPLGPNSMIDCLHSQINQLRLVGERLCHLETHDAINILHHSLSIPKLLHILRTSPVFLHLFWYPGMSYSCLFGSESQTLI